ncbi:MAG: hypothetical protein KJ646_05640, partial [Nanoarchaeota archaeon]|nr:hypothetical protein [Nanoarchaeota archaeon]MBU4116193.1 hypothetical protein [Nanoarchaeota archaeon]
MKQREFGWHVILYNIRMNLKNSDSSSQKSLNFFIFQIRIYLFSDNASITLNLMFINRGGVNP